MKANYTEEERYYQAQKKVEGIKKFYQHLTVYLLCNPIVIAVNLMTSPEFLWCIFSVIGWGIPVGLHGLTAFNKLPFLDKEWEERKLNEILGKENNKQKWE